MSSFYPTGFQPAFSVGSVPQFGKKQVTIYTVQDAIENRTAQQAKNILRQMGFQRQGENWIHQSSGVEVHPDFLHGDHYDVTQGRDKIRVYLDTSVRFA